MESSYASMTGVRHAQSNHPMTVPGRSLIRCAPTPHHRWWWSKSAQLVRGLDNPDRVGIFPDARTAIHGHPRPCGVPVLRKLSMPRGRRHLGDGNPRSHGGCGNSRNPRSHRGRRHSILSGGVSETGGHRTDGNAAGGNNCRADRDQAGCATLTGRWGRRRGVRVLLERTWISNSCG